MHVRKQIIAPPVPAEILVTTHLGIKKIVNAKKLKDDDSMMQSEFLFIFLFHYSHSFVDKNYKFDQSVTLCVDVKWYKRQALTDIYLPM